MFFIICYDTPSTKRRNKLAKTLLGYATRVQKSVFETHLEREKVQELIVKMNNIIDPDEDNLRLYEIPKDYLPKIQVWGKVSLVENLPFYYISDQE